MTAAEQGRRQSVESGTREELLGRLAEAVDAVKVAHPIRVAVDGAPAAGKTTLADELAVVLRSSGRDVIRATIDDFMFPRAPRYRRGEYSPESSYLDAHDNAALNASCSIRSARAETDASRRPSTTAPPTPCCPRP